LPRTSARSAARRTTSTRTSGAPVDADALVTGIAAVFALNDVTILAVPDAVLLPPDDFAKVVQAMVAQCTELRNRVAILDVYAQNDANAGVWQAPANIELANVTDLTYRIDDEENGRLTVPAPSSAFAVQCGIGSTMSAADLAAGRMNVTVEVALQHPAEFTVLTFTQPLAVSS
jgi:phage tail sheath protein FI